MCSLHSIVQEENNRLRAILQQIARPQRPVTSERDGPEPLQQASSRPAMEGSGEGAQEGRGEGSRAMLVPDADRTLAAEASALCLVLASHLRAMRRLQLSPAPHHGMTPQTPFETPALQGQWS